MIRLDIPATYAALKALSVSIGDILSRVDEIDDRERITYAIQLAAHEICTNIIDHAYTGAENKWIKATLRLTTGMRKLEIELEDTGIACDPGSIADPDLSIPQESGYGMYLVRNLVDSVQYRRSESHNYWTLVKQL